jgi:hypothetical protein
MEGKWSAGRTTRREGEEKKNGEVWKERGETEKGRGVREEGRGGEESFLTENGADIYCTSFFFRAKKIFYSGVTISARNLIGEQL